MTFTMTKIVRDSPCGGLENKVGFNPISSKSLLRDFLAVLGSRHPGQFCSQPLLAPAPLTGHRGPMLLSLLVVNSEMMCPPARQAPVTSLPLLPGLAEGSGHFPLYLLPVPSLKKSSSCKGLSEAYF